MKPTILRTILALALASLCGIYAEKSNAENPEPQSAVCPRADCVPDAKTAVRIAEAVLIPVYGEKHVIRERPLTARLDGDRWIVKGTLPKGRRAGEIVAGGTAMAEIARRDGRILDVYHLK